MQKNMESRVNQLEQNDAGMRVEINNLISVTRDNTHALRGLTETLAYNKGIIVASAKFAGLLTMVIAALWAVGSKIVDVFHIGPK